MTVRVYVDKPKICFGHRMKERLILVEYRSVTNHISRLFLAKLLAAKNEKLLALHVRDWIRSIDESTR